MGGIGIGVDVETGVRGDGDDGGRCCGILNEVGWH